MSHLIYSGGANYIGVHDLAAAASWYTQKLALREIEIEMDDGEGCVALGFSSDAYALTLGPAGKPTDELHPLLYATNVKKARDVLNSRGVSVGEIQKDGQGTHYFEMRDLEGNVIEICEEP
jgi:catechol 2,3-dioxygenase-like lactoylglutathione lyase family enzyme